VNALFFGRKAGNTDAEQVVLHGEQRGRGAGRNADFVVNVLDVMAGGFGGDAETVCDFAVGKPTRQQPQHVDFTVTQVCDPRSAQRCAFACSRFDDRRDGLLIEPSRT
jgi:hypothetical protein